MGNPFGANNDHLCGAVPVARREATPRAALKLANGPSDGSPCQWVGRRQSSEAWAAAHRALALRTGGLGRPREEVWSRASRGGREALAAAQSRHRGLAWPLSYSDKAYGAMSAAVGGPSTQLTSHSPSTVMKVRSPRAARPRAPSAPA